ncbi:MAG: M23 family metallopeptidase [Synechococcaceae bacterium WB5_2A_257]|nr:M23 family metallopeptidase [Synechococcaceae bacterium WB5_2A_257]
MKPSALLLTVSTSFPVAFLLSAGMPVRSNLDHSPFLSSSTLINNSIQHSSHPSKSEPIASSETPSLWARVRYDITVEQLANQLDLSAERLAVLNDCDTSRKFVAGEWFALPNRSGYGWRWGRMHRGIDIANNVGTPIVAVADGVVASSGWNEGGYGYLVEISHPDGTFTRYAHNSRLLVSKGMNVSQGTPLALMGSTGRSTGPHLHFEIIPPSSGAANPLAFLPPK